MTSFEQSLRDELEVPGEFPPEVTAEAEAAARRPLPDVTDLRRIDFATLDPAGARDLDQAYALDRTAHGYVVRYAIADVAHFVDSGGAIDGEAHRRGVTIYLPDGRAPLHPPVLSEGAASLSPGQDRPSVVWTIELASAGAVRTARVERALVRSRRQLEYATVDDPLLREVGEVLEADEAARGGVSLDLPAQDVVARGDRWEVVVDEVLPSEGWNEQLSLLAGRCAAQLMLEGRVGILRTMPPPDDDVVAELRRLARALGISWRQRDDYATVVRSIDRRDRCGVVFLEHAKRAMRGAGYVAFDGDLPELERHSAVAAPYAHVTAPLRRLADRYANEVVLSLCASQPVPAWARDGLAELPDLMDSANRRAAAAERAAIDLAEAMSLTARVGEVLDAMVVSVDDRGAVVAARSPVVVARSARASRWEPGDAVRVRVDAVDVEARRIELAPA